MPSNVISGMSRAKQIVKMDAEQRRPYFTESNDRILTNSLAETKTKKIAKPQKWSDVLKITLERTYRSGKIDASKKKVIASKMHVEEKKKLLKSL